MIKSDFIAEKDLNICINCGKYEKWSYFGARILINNKVNFNSISCFGCGICVSKCPNNTINLIKQS